MVEATYPEQIRTFTDKVDEVDDIDDDHINLLQKELEAVQEAIGTYPGGSQNDLMTRLGVLVSTSGAFRQGIVFPTNPIEGQGFYRQDEDTYYIFDGTDWDAVGSSLSNVIYEFHGGDGFGVMASLSSSVPNSSDTVVMWHKSSTWTTKSTSIYHKLQGQLTLTGHFRFSSQDNQVRPRFSFGVNGSTTALPSGSTLGTSGTVSSTTIELDISALAEGTTYSLTINMSNDGGVPTRQAHITDIVIRAS